jgi:hypothetical protein
LLRQILQLPGDSVEPGVTCGAVSALKGGARHLKRLGKILQSASGTLRSLEKLVRHIAKFGRQRIEAFVESLHLIRSFTKITSGHLLGGLLESPGLTKDRCHLGDAVADILGIKIARLQLLLQLFQLLRCLFESDIALLEVLNHFFNLCGDLSILSGLRLFEQLEGVFETLSLRLA